MHNKGDIAYIILSCIAVAGVIALLPLAPGMGAILKLVDPNPRRAAYKIDRTLRALIKGGKVAKTKAGYRLTADGEVELARRTFERYQFSELKKWDKKWRVICFDIPEKRKYTRQVVQQKLKELGCYRLQDSVFVTLHPCGELLDLMHRSFFLQKYVRAMIVTKIDDETALRRHFSLM